MNNTETTRSRRRRRDLTASQKAEKRWRRKINFSDLALKCAELGWSVIPVSRETKEPFVKWKEHQKERPTPEQIIKWWGKWPHANIGIVTGAISNLDVIDFDSPEAIERFKAEVCKIPETIKQSTGRLEGGTHCFFTHNEKLVSKRGVMDQVDLRAEGGCVIVAPSSHQTGKKYRWIGINPLEDGLDSLADMPPEMVEFFATKKGKGKDYGAEKIDDIIKEAVAELNTKHAVIMSGGKCAILNEVWNPVFDRPDITISDITDLKNWYSNQRVPNPKMGKGQPKEVSIAKVWVESPERRQYEGIVFSPKKDVPGYYNLYRGFAVEPKKGNWSLFRDHIRDVIAGGREDCFEWLLAWMARIAKDPGGERPGTSLVLRGKQGTGKGVYGNLFGEIFGSHFLHITNQNQLVGRFNSHLKDSLLVFVDEAFWAGAKSAEGVLKGMVTEEYILVEPKFKDAFMIRNHVNLIIASNHQWVVPAGLEERRFFVLDVSNNQKQNHEYFAPISKQMNEEGGKEAMLFDLLEMDISGVNLRAFPQTDALFEQKLHSMDPLAHFWYERLNEGRLLGDRGLIGRYEVESSHATEDLIKEYQTKWKDTIVTQILYTGFQLFQSTTNKRSYLPLNHFVRSLKKICPNIETGLRIKMKNKSRTAGALRIPPLADCRTAFEDTMQTVIEWETEVDVDYTYSKPDMLRDAVKEFEKRKNRD